MSAWETVLIAFGVAVATDVAIVLVGLRMARRAFRGLFQGSSSTASLVSFAQTTTPTVARAPDAAP